MPSIFRKLLAFLVTLAAVIIYFQRTQDKPSAHLEFFRKGQALHKHQKNILNCLSEKATETFICGEGFGQALAKSDSQDSGKILTALQSQLSHSHLRRSLALGIGIGLAETTEIDDLIKMAQTDLQEFKFQLVDGWAFGRTTPQLAPAVYEICQKIPMKDLQAVCLFGLGRKTYLLRQVYLRSIEIFEDFTVKLGYGFASHFIGGEQSSSEASMQNGIDLARNVIFAMNAKETTQLSSCLNKFPSHAIFCYAGP